MVTAAQALARVYFGEWVADCPRPGCTNTEAIMPGQWTFFCGDYARRMGQPLHAYCQWTGQILWPGNAYDIHVELQRRPVKGTRHWFPPGYPAERLPAGPDVRGQTIDHLASEFMKHDPVAAKERP